MERHEEEEAREALLAKCLESAPEAKRTSRAAVEALKAVQASLAVKGDANFAECVIALHKALTKMLELGRLQGLR